MTIEEAIKILEESQRQNKVMLESPTTFFRATEMEDGIKNAEQRIVALDMAITALRAQTDFNGTYVNVSWLKQVEDERDALKNAKLDRSLWNGCDWCRVGCKNCVYNNCAVIGGREPCKTCKNYSNYVQTHPGKFCRECGKPLTEEAWAVLERRMNDGKAD